MFNSISYYSEEKLKLEDIKQVRSKDFFYCLQMNNNDFLFYWSDNINLKISFPDPENNKFLFCNKITSINKKNKEENELLVFDDNYKDIQGIPYSITKNIYDNNLLPIIPFCFQKRLYIIKILKQLPINAIIDDQFLLLQSVLETYNIKQSLLEDLLEQGIIKKIFSPRYILQEIENVNSSVFIRKNQIYTEYWDEDCIILYKFENENSFEICKNFYWYNPLDKKLKKIIQYISKEDLFPNFASTCNYNDITDDVITSLVCVFRNNNKIYSVNLKFNKDLKRGISVISYQQFLELYLTDQQIKEDQLKDKLLNIKNLQPIQIQTLEEAKEQIDNKEEVTFQLQSIEKFEKLQLKKKILLYVIITSFLVIVLTLSYKYLIKPKLNKSKEIEPQDNL